MDLCYAIFHLSLQPLMIELVVLAALLPTLLAFKCILLLHERAGGKEKREANESMREREGDTQLSLYIASFLGLQ